MTTDERDPATAVEPTAGSRSVAARLGRFVPGAIRRRYALKFAVSILLVVLVISLIGVYGLAEADGAVRTSTEDQLKETSELRAASLGEFVGRMELQTRTVSSGRPLIDEEGRSEFLRLHHVWATDDVLALHLVDTSEGEVAASTVHPLEGRSVETVSVPWATADVPSGPGNETEVWRSETSYQSPVMGNEPVIAFASSVPGHADQYVVVIARIQDHLDEVDGEQTGRTMIVNRAGDRVLQPGGAYDTTAHETRVRSAREGGASEFRVGDDRVHAYAPVPGTGWVAITTLEKGTAFAVQQQVRSNVLLIVVSALVTLGLVGVVIGHQTIAPLTELRDRARRMEEGNLSVDLETDRTDEIGRLYRSFASMRDELKAQIRESNEARREAETLAEQLRVAKQRSDEQFRTLFETAPDPVVVVSASGTIENVNPEFETVFGHDHDTVEGSDFVEFGFAPPERVRRIAETLNAETLDEPPCETYTLTYERDDDAFVIEMNADLLVDEGAVIGWVGILRDVTERERQRRQLEEKNERLEEFTSIVSHDLRNPLNVASGYLELARGEYEPDESGPLAEVEWAHDQMYQLIDELLTLAQQGRTITDVTLVDPRDVASEAWSSVDTDDSTLRIGDELGPIEADANRLSQLFENLFRNAVDHNPDPVAVTVGAVEDGFYVADGGVGIPEDEREEIFDHGYTTDDDGTGFGLSIVDRIVDAHGWTVTIAESDDGGARFEIRQRR